MGKLQNFEMLLKVKIKQSLRQINVIFCSWIGKLNIINVSVLLKLIYKFNNFLMKTPPSSVRQLDILTIKFI